MDVETGLWIPCGRSEDCQLDVKGLTAMKRYKFRVCAINEEGESEPCTMRDEIVAKDPFGQPGPPIHLELVDWDQGWKFMSCSHCKSWVNKQAGS